MIIKNEEKHLPRLFKSFEGCFDEIHITDTGSTDNSVELAKSLGAIVHHFDWVNDFSAARNYSFSHAKTDYIMWIDADDELVDAKGFIAFRDSMMAMAEYWVARYDYSTDPTTGQAVCYFARERVIKNNKGMAWKYPIHEGILPPGKMSDIAAQYTNAFVVKHVRTAEDLEKDRSRNIKLFEQISDDKLDARMRYYYGKELFEIGRPEAAAPQLVRAAQDQALEAHDKILAIQYACYAYLSTNKFQEVIELAHHGLKLNPNRAEYWCLLGDAYLKLNKITDALPCFSAAKGCVQPNKEQPSAVFFHEQTYNIYPMNQIARIHANIGNLDKAYLEAKDCFEKYPNGESRAIKEEIVRIKAFSEAYKTATPCADIVISCPPVGTYKWDPELAKTNHMGGSETATMEMAYHLHTLSGRNVLVFNQREEEATFDGVKYLPSTKIAEYMSKNKPFLHIAWRHNMKITDAPTYLWCHDLYAPEIEKTERYVKVLALSEFHKNFLMTSFKIPENKIHVTRNGIKPERFSSVDLTKKNKNKFIFSSSPDRGIDRTIKVLDKVRETHPEIELHAFYGIEQLKSYGRPEKYDEIKALLDSRPWVKFHGGVSQTELMEHMQESCIWLYPTNFMETSCITAMEMLGNKVYPIVRKFGALPYTLSKAENLGMASILDSDCVTDAEIEFYANEVKLALETRAWERINIDMNEMSWQSVANEWLFDLSNYTALIGVA